MNESSSYESRKVKAAYAAIVPFLLAEAIILVLAYTDFEMSRFFFAIMFGANVVLAVLIFAVISGGRQRR